MGSYSIGEALQLLIEKSKWKDKITGMRMHQEWEAIVGKAIARYTRNLMLYQTTLTIYSDVAALKQELYYGKEQLIKRINEYFGDTVVTDIVIR